MKIFILKKHTSSRGSIYGFTLIELLVVVAIIGILATIIISSLNSARAKARDARRQSDIKTIQNDLEIYYADNGHYPIGGFKRSNDPTEWAAFESELGVTLPTDPINEAGNIFQSPYSTLSYGYYADGNPAWCSGQLYLILYNMETKTDTEQRRLRHCNSGNTSQYGQAFLVGVSPNN